MKILKSCLAVLAAAFVLQACTIDTLIEGNPNPESSLVWSENSVFTEDKRFFIVGGKSPIFAGPSAIFEITKNEDGSYQNETIVEGDFNGTHCYFGGLTSRGMNLYGVCVAPGFAGVKLYRVDMSKNSDDPTRVATTYLFTPAFQANGMTFDEEGTLYISNSASVVVQLQYGLTVPAIVKVELTDDGSTLTATETPFVLPENIGYFPNGIAVDGDKMILASGNQLFAIPMLENGTAGEAVVIYEGPETQLFDDFDLLPGGIVALAEISTVGPELAKIFYPDLVMPEESINQVDIINTSNGELLGVIPFDSAVLPSSVQLAEGFLFEPLTLIVTDAVGSGGLYQIKR